MRNIAIILLFVIAIACSSKMKKKPTLEVEQQQAVSVIDDSEAFEREMLALGDDMILSEDDKIIKDFKEIPIVKKAKKTKKAPTTIIAATPKPALVIPRTVPSSHYKKVTSVKSVDKQKNKKKSRSDLMVFDQITKSMISIENCLHIVYNNKQFSQPTCLKTVY